MGTRTGFVCKKCGKYDAPHRPGRSACKRCEGEYVKQWKSHQPEKQKSYNRKIAERRLQIKKLCVDYKGGKCQMEPQCLYPLRNGIDPCFMVYEFHHEDPSTKTMEFSRRIRKGSRTSKKITTIEDLKLADPELIAELDKCRLLCGNCHAYLEYCSGCTRKEPKDERTRPPRNPFDYDLFA